MENRSERMVAPVWSELESQAGKADAWPGGGWPPIDGKVQVRFDLLPDSGVSRSHCGGLALRPETQSLGVRRRPSESGVFQ